MQNLLRYAGATLVICLLAAGCGGSGGASPLRKAQFVQRANAICQTAEAEREMAMKEAAAAGTDSNPAAALKDVLLPSVQKMLEELNELGPPAGEEKEVEAIVSAFEEGVANLEGGSFNLRADISAFAEANELAVQYGLTDCGI